MKLNLTLDTSSFAFRTIFTLSLFLFSFILIGSSAYSAWTNPTGTAPAGNTDAPVNVGATSQIKSGPLQVNGFSNTGYSVFGNGVSIGGSTGNTGWRLHATGDAYGIYADATTGQAIRGYASNGYAGYFIGYGGVYAQNTSGYYAYLGYPGSSWGVYTNGSLYVGASAYATAFYYNSDESLKENVAELDGLDIVKKLRGVSFTWKETGEDSVGLIAQEVEKVLPELVSTDSKTGLKSVQYGNLVGPLIEAVKEQQTEIDELQSQLKALSEKVDALSK